VAEADPPTVGVAPMGERTLLELTLPAISTYRAQVGMFLVTLSPGTGFEEHTGAGPQLFYVAEGPVTVRTATAPQPLELIPPDGPGENPAKVLVAEGEQATLETGTTLLAPAGAAFALFTTGPTAAHLVDLLSATNSQRHGDGIDRQFASNGGMTVDLAAPVSIILRQGRLMPDAALPASTAQAVYQVVAPLEAAEMSDLRSGSGGAVRNAGKEPVELYVLTVTAGEAAALADGG
jgi:hypothetical protein